MAPEKPPGVVQYRKFSQDDLPEEAPPSRSELLIEEPVFEEPQRKRVGENVWRSLGERQINMIAFSGTIGNGLFLGSGRSLAGAGPGGALVAYLLMGAVMSAVISCLGEMTALMPVNAPVMEFPRRFVDRGVGFAVGWMYWFAYAVLAADQLVAATNSVKFHYEDEHTLLSWKVGENVHAAVWITLVLVVVTIVNMFPVKVFGQLEYIFGSIKLAFISFLILMSVLIDTMKPRANAYYNKPLGTKYWDAPYGFFNRQFPIKDENGNLQRMMTGSMGSFLGMWTTLINVIFSYVGMDIVAATAAESKALADSEAMKMASRKVSLRIITTYALTVLTASFTVPMDHRFLNGEAQSVGAQSIFIIAVVEAGMPAMAHFYNAMYLFSAFTCAINSMYVASRVLHTLALRDQTGPEWITKRLRLCHAGVPVRTVLVTAALMLVAYMGPTGAPGLRLGELASNCTVSCLIVYANICGTYLCFFRTLQDIKDYANTSETQAACYDRNHPRYPYKSHGQWLKALFGLISCVVLVLFNGIAAFLERPFNPSSFVAAYIGLPVYILLIFGYKVKRHGFRFSEWGPERSNDLSNAVQVTSEKRKGRLEFPDDGFTSDNFKAFFRWLWAWMK